MKFFLKAEAFIRISATLSDKWDQSGCIANINLPVFITLRVKAGRGGTLFIVIFAK